MEDDEIDLKKFLFILERNLILILTIFLIVLFCFFIYLYNTPEIYESKSILKFIRYKENFSYETRIINSHLILDKVYKELGSDFEFTLLPITQYNTIEIITRSEKPNIAKNTANGIAKSYINYLNETNNSRIAYVIESAELPSKPIKPNILFISVLGITIGLILGFGVAYLKEKLIRKKEEKYLQY